MSVHKVARQNGWAWKVRYREDDGRARSRTFDRRADALQYDAEVRRRKQVGTLVSLDAGKLTVAAFAEQEWWPLHVATLAARTQKNYAEVFDRHLLPRVGHLRLRDVTTGTVARLRADLESAGIGKATVRKALVILQGIFSHAVAWSHVQTNPVAGVRKPSGKRTRAVSPPPPATVEAMRSSLLAAGDLRDATLLSVLAYGGLRPQEALALSWGHVRERTLFIERAVADGSLKTTKTGATRSVRLLGPLAADLAAWRLANGRPDASSLVFSTRDGSAWRDHDWRNWRRRVFDRQASAVGAPTMRPYDLRHAFCSLLLHEGQTVVEVAAQAGHSPTMTLTTYGHLMAEIGSLERRSAEGEIRAAREALVSGMCLPREIATVAQTGIADRA